MDRTAMFFTRRRAPALAGVLLLAAGLTGCASQTTLSPDFGRSVHENLVAQISDPDPAWRNRPQPPADGVRVGLAQERYRTGKTIQPKPAAASDIGLVVNFGSQPN